MKSHAKKADALDIKLDRAHKTQGIKGYSGCTKVHRWNSADSTAYKAGKYRVYLRKKHKLFA